jgi:hypothetical protein
MIKLQIMNQIKSKIENLVKIPKLLVKFFVDISIHRVQNIQIILTHS